jgi:hypothetical protein
MLQRIRGVRQDEASRERHWFQDEYFDLFVWTEPSGAVVSFQLCYDRSRHERVLAWNWTEGLTHRRVDDGEQTPVKNRSPIMATDARGSIDGVAAEFDRRGMELDARMRDFILQKIEEAAIQFSG